VADRAACPSREEDGASIRTRFELLISSTQSSVLRFAVKRDMMKRDIVSLSASRFLERAGR
jgi:hypothetical protein